MAGAGPELAQWGGVIEPSLPEGPALLGFVAARIAARPLRAMATAADRIARGDYAIRVAATSPDDFGRLAESLASLAAQLEQRIGELTAERDRLSAILAGMVEAVLVTGARGEVLVATDDGARNAGGAPPPQQRVGAPRGPGERRCIDVHE